MAPVSLKHVGLIVKASRGHGAAVNACGEVKMGGDGGKLWRWEEMVESAKRRASVGRLLWNDTSLPLNLANVDTPSLALPTYAYIWQSCVGFDTK